MKRLRGRDSSSGSAGSSGDQSTLPGPLHNKLRHVGGSRSPPSEHQRQGSGGSAHGATSAPAAAAAALAAECQAGHESALLPAVLFGDAPDGGLAAQQAAHQDALGLPPLELPSLLQALPQGTPSAAVLVHLRQLDMAQQLQQQIEAAHALQAQLRAAQGSAAAELDELLGGAAPPEPLLLPVEQSVAASPVAAPAAPPAAECGGGRDACMAGPDLDLLLQMHPEDLADALLGARRRPAACLRLLGCLLCSLAAVWSGRADTRRLPHPPLPPAGYHTSPPDPAPLAAPAAPLPGAPSSIPTRWSPAAEPDALLPGAGGSSSVAGLPPSATSPLAPQLHVGYSSGSGGALPESNSAHAFSARAGPASWPSRGEDRLATFSFKVGGGGWGWGAEGDVQ